MGGQNVFLGCTSENISTMILMLQMAVLYFLETWEGKDVGGRRVAEALLSTLGWEIDTNVALFDVDEICCCHH